MSTAVLPLLGSATTVETTVLRTQFVTIVVTTQPAQSRSAPATDSTSTTADAGMLLHFTSKSEVLSSATSTTSVRRSSSASTHSSESTIGGTQPSPTSRAPTGHGHSSISRAHKRALVGGLSGAIAGLLLVGVIIALLLRRRRDRDFPDEPIDEKSNDLPVSPALNALALEKINPAPTRQSSRTATPNADGRIIRMSTQHWSRPFAHSQSFRESIGPGQLRVTNPDLSRPSTAHSRSFRAPTEALHSRATSRSVTPALRPPSQKSSSTYLKPQRSATTTMTTGGNHSRASSNTPSSRPPPTQDSSTVVETMVAISRPAGPPPTPPPFHPPFSTATPNLPNAPSITQPPPPPERTHPSHPPSSLLIPPTTTTTSTPKLLTPLSAAPSRSPLRSRPWPSTHLAEPEQTFSHYSASTFSSAGGPFRLDWRRGGMEEEERMAVETPMYVVYEGT